MTAHVIRLRPRPGPARSARPTPPPAVPVLDEAVSVEWDHGRGLYVLACDRCTETALFARLDQAHQWAETHRCDPELAALLAHITEEAA